MVAASSCERRRWHKKGGLGGPVLLHLAHHLEALARDAQGLVDGRLRHGQRRRGRRLAVHLLAVDGARVGRGGAAAGSRVLSHVVEHAPQQGGEGRHLAGPEERQRVCLDCRGPVGRVGVERVEEVFLYPMERRRRRSDRAWNVILQTRGEEQQQQGPEAQAEVKTTLCSWLGQGGKEVA